MRFVAVDGRASLVRGDAVFDVAECSDDAIPADPMLVLRDHWDDLAALALAGGGRPLSEVMLGAPVPRPPLILSLIANYPPASKSAFPMIVGKAPSAVTGPGGEIVLPDPRRLPLGRAYVIGTVLLCGAGSRLDGRPPPGLGAGDVIRTEIAGVGIIENRCRNESGFM